MYTDNDYRLYHSFKGTTWKNHLYTAKKAVGGKIRYFYNNADPLGFKKRDELEEEQETLRKYKRDYAYEQDFSDYSYSVSKQMEEDYKKTGNIGSKYAGEFATRTTNDSKEAMYTSGNWYSPGTRQLSEQANRVAKLQNEYAKTPLGRCEKFIEPGARALSNALKYIDDTVDNLTKRR